MLEKILLRNVSSYSPDAPVSIAPLKRVSLFYGQNGTGKTTIGNFLQAQGEACYSVCGVEPVKVGREVDRWKKQPYEIMRSEFSAMSHSRRNG